MIFWDFRGYFLNITDSPCVFLGGSVILLKPLLMEISSFPWPNQLHVVSRNNLNEFLGLLGFFFNITNSHCLD
jgi:hypothetical protein